MSFVSICEVGPRDGLQIAKTRMTTDDKVAWIVSLAAAGIKEIEVGSFVPPRVIPQLADTRRGRGEGSGRAARPDGAGAGAEPARRAERLPRRRPQDLHSGLGQRRATARPTSTARRRSRSR